MPESEGSPALVQELFAFSAHYTGTDSSRVPADDEMETNMNVIVTAQKCKQTAVSARQGCSTHAQQHT